MLEKWPGHEQYDHPAIRKNHLLYLDTRDDSFELIPTAETMKPYKIAILFSGLERSLANSKYNLRQDECKAADTGGVGLSIATLALNLGVQ